MITVTYLALAFLITSGIKVNRQGFFDSYLSLENTNHLRGFFSLLVILCHLTKRIACGSDRFCMPLLTTGYLCVGVFFFLSGFGLMTSFLKKRNRYARSFLRMRIPTIVIPYITAMALYLLVRQTVENPYRSLIDVVRALTHATSLVSFSWYIIAVLVFYLLFYATLRLFPKNPRRIAWVNLLGSLLYCTILHARNFGDTWYNSCLALPFGIFVALYSAQLCQLAKRFFSLLTPAFAVLFLLLHVLRIYITHRPLSDWVQFADGLIAVIVPQLATIALILFLIFLLMKVRPTNHATAFLGSISFEIYLYHGLIMFLCRNESWHMQSDDLYLATVVLGSLILATIMHQIDKGLIGKLIPARQT